MFLHSHQHEINFWSLMLHFFRLLYSCYVVVESQKCMN